MVLDLIEIKRFHFLISFDKSRYCRFDVEYERLVSLFLADTSFNIFAILSAQDYLQQISTIFRQFFQFQFQKKKQ